MAEEAQLVVQLEARIRDFERNFQRANRVANDNFGNIERRGRTAARALETTFSSTSTNITKSLAGLGAGAAGLRTAFGAIAAGLGLNEMRRAADTYTGIMNQLKVAGVSSGSLPATFDALFQSAQRNAVPLDALAQLYGRVSQAQTTLKASSQEILRVTDIVAQSLRVSGKSASESSGALLQLAQAFSGGKVQAEEYNSLLDGAYPLLQAAAAGMREAGGDVARLTSLVKDGKVSSEAFFRAIEAGAPVLSEKLAGATLTSGQAFQQLQNELVRAVGEFDKATGASAALAGGMGTVAASIGPIGQAATDATLKVQGLMKALGDLAAASGAALTSALSSAQQGTAATQRAILEAKLRGAIGPERTGIEKQLRDLDAGPQNPSAKAAREADERSRYIQAGRDIGDLTNIPAGVGVANVPQPVARPAGIGGPTIKPISLANYAVPGDKDGKGSGGGGSGDKVSKYDREVQQVEKRTAALREEATTIGKSTYEIERSRIAHQLEFAAKQAGVPINDALRASIDRAAQGYAGAKAEVEKLKTAHDGLISAQKFAGEALTDGLIDVVVEGRSAIEVVQNLAKSFAKAALQAALMGSGPLGGLFGGGGKGVGGIVGLLFGGIGLADGGYVTGPGTSRSDSIPARLSAGEFVINARATAQNRDLLHAINSGSLPAFADGGLVGSAPAIPAPDRFGNSSSAINQSVNVHVNATGGDPKQNKDLADQIGRRVQQELRGMIGGEIRAQLRPNGQIREALR